MIHRTQTSLRPVASLCTHRAIGRGTTVLIALVASFSVASLSGCNNLAPAASAKRSQQGAGVGSVHVLFTREDATALRAIAADLNDPQSNVYAAQDKDDTNILGKAAQFDAMNRNRYAAHDAAPVHDHNTVDEGLSEKCDDRYESPSCSMYRLEALFGIQPQDIDEVTVATLEFALQYSGTKATADAKSYVDRGAHPNNRLIDREAMQTHYKSIRAIAQNRLGVETHERQNVSLSNSNLNSYQKQAHMLLVRMDYLAKAWAQMDNAWTGGSSTSLEVFFSLSGWLVPWNLTIFERPSVELTTTADLAATNQGLGLKYLGIREITTDTETVEQPTYATQSWLRQYGEFSNGIVQNVKTPASATPQLIDR